MWDLTPDFHGLASSMACDKELLPELGRASWAATCLRANVRTVLEDLRGPRPAPSRWPAIGPSLAEDVRELESIAEGTALAEWCRSVAANAVAAHDAVVHEIVHGTPLDDGSGVARPPERPPYGRNELIEVTGRLVNAANTLPADAVSSHVRPQPNPT